MPDFPPALPHGSFDEVLPGFHVVTGAMKMNAMMSFDRNMTVVVEGERLVIFNSIRLDETGLAALEALGKVTDVVRVGAHHGRDDAFYVDRYGAQLWAPLGCSKGLNPKELNESTQLPLEGASVFLFEGVSKPETVIHLGRQGGVVLPCDALQNWCAPHPEYTSFMAKLAMRPMGFFTPTAMGAGWRKAMKPAASEAHRLLDAWSFENVLPAHGEPVLGGAKAKFTATIEAIFPR